LWDAFYSSKATLKILMITIALQRLLRKPKRVITKTSMARFLIILVIPILMAKTLIAIQTLLSHKKIKVILLRNLMKRK
jgi:hypothetical protein